MDLKAAIRTIPDYPKPGIQFRDITTLLGNAEAFRSAVDRLAAAFAAAQPSQIAGVEARGFILGGAVADRLGVGFTPVRKQGKLPHHTHIEEYELEYGVDAVEIHVDALNPGERVVIIDDLIATGGTAEAAVKLLRKGGGEVIGCGVVIDLPELGGAAKLEAMGVPVTALVAFEGH